MPTIYLSPSTQEYNPYVTGGGSEEYYMNLIADAMIPYLQSNGIQYVRNTPEMTAGSSLRASNQGNYDLHVAIHSNASGEGQEGQNRGEIIFYYPSSTSGKRFADILAQNFRNIYPNPELVKTVPTTTLGEVSRTRAPSVLFEVAYHDNVQDANWIVNNINTIAQTIVTSLAEYFNTTGGSQPSTGQPGGNQNGRTGRVTLQSGYLNIRSGPSLNSPVIAMAPNGSSVTILGQSGDWYNVNYNGTVGYASSQYIK